MNTTKIYRAKNDGKSNYYTKMSNDIAEDNRLNATQMGIMFLILKNSDDFVLNKGYIRKKSGLGERAFATAWKALVKYGYITEERVNTPSGAVYNYVVKEHPGDEVEIETPKTDVEEAASEEVNKVYDTIKYMNVNILGYVKAKSWSMTKRDKDIIESALKDKGADELTDMITGMVSNTRKAYNSVSYYLNDYNPYSISKTNAQVLDEI